METIFALATAPGRSGVAVIRISGPQAKAAAEALAGPLPEAGRSLRRLRDASGAVIDEALVLTFEPGHSFTGEAVVELQCHGSMAVVARLQAVLGGQPGLRPAEAGEFTRRALENGRLDLAQVEGLADLIDAETEGQRAQALRLYQGSLSNQVDRWRDDLVQALALVEATIDFADEEVPVDVSPEVRRLIAGLERQLQEAIAGVAVAERMRDGFEVAIVGPPNVGKSTLLNQIAGREVAITSEIAGTTRDVIEVRADLGGLPVTFLDTAGLRGATDRIEQIGIDRGLARARAADIRIHLVEAGGESGLSVEPQDIVVVGKADTSGGDVSGVTGQGVDDLLARLRVVLEGRTAVIGVAVKERHRQLIERALRELAAVDLGLLRAQPEVIAEHLRLAARALGAIVGRVDVEEILGAIFSRFCIGK